MFQETDQKLDKALSQLKLVQGGTQVDPGEARAIVRFWHGEPWRQIESAWMNGVISDDDFFQQAMVLINQFADRHNLRRPEVA